MLKFSNAKLCRVPIMDSTISSFRTRTFQPQDRIWRVSERNPGPPRGYNIPAFRSCKDLAKLTSISNQIDLLSCLLSSFSSFWRRPKYSRVAVLSTHTHTFDEKIHQHPTISILRSQRTSLHASHDCGLMRGGFCFTPTKRHHQSLSLLPQL